MRTHGNVYVMHSKAGNFLLLDSLFRQTQIDYGLDADPREAPEAFERRLTAAVDLGIDAVEAWNAGGGRGCRLQDRRK